MFNISGSEIIVILLLALVILGPEKLPDALRRAGRTYSELKRMGNSFQSEMRNVIDEPVKEMRETANMLQSSATFTDHEPNKPGSGGRAAAPVPTRSASSTGSTARASVTASAPASEPGPSAAADGDEALINRTLSGHSDPPAGDDAR